MQWSKITRLMVDFHFSEDRAGRLVGIEVKCAASLQRQDFRGLETLAELSGRRFVNGVLLYIGATAVPFGRKLHALPLSRLWL